MDYRSRKTIQIQLDMTRGGKEYDTNAALVDYIDTLKHNRQWKRVFKNALILHETLEAGDVSKLKELFPHIYLQMILEAQAVTPRQVSGHHSDDITDADRDRYERLKKSLGKI